MKLLTGDMPQPLLQQMCKMASLCTDTSPEISPVIVSRLIDCLLYARPDRTQTLLQLVFQMFQQVLKVIWEERVAHAQLFNFNKVPTGSSWDAPNSPPKLPLPLWWSPPYLIYLFLNWSLSPPQMASRSNRPFCHTTLSGYIYTCRQMV